MPLLEEFQLLQELNDNEREPHAELAEYVHFLPHAPHLRNLKLDAGILHCVTFARLPALVELHIDAHYKQLCPASLFRLLSMCKQVKKLTVGPDYRDSGPRELAALVAGQPAPVLTLPNLTDLIINGTVALFSDIAPVLSCPALCDLEINALYKGLPDELQVIESLICTNITSLYIYSFESDGDGALASILRTLPHLRELEICQMALFGVDLAPLCAPDERTGQWIAPRLQQINFESILNYDGDAVVQLLKFVDARTAAGASELDNSPVWPLRKVNVCAHREKIGSVPSWVQDTINRFLNRVVGDVTSSGATCR